VCLDEIAVAVEAGELADDSAFELLAREALVAAGFRSVFLAAGASVVVVKAAVVARAHADVGLATTTTTKDAREEEVACVPAALGDVAAALVQDRLGELEGGVGNEGVVDARAALAKQLVGDA
jgi:hypothetical protein